MNDTLVNELKSVGRDADDLLEATGQGGPAIEEAKSRLKATLERAKESARMLQEKAMQGVKATDQVIRTHPYQSIGIAFAAGLLIGVLAARRSRND